MTKGKTKQEKKNKGPRCNYQGVKKKFKVVKLTNIAQILSQGTLLMKI